jgi:hypothetical protein
MSGAILAGWLFFVPPPLEHRGEVMTLVQFMPRAAIDGHCRKAGVEAAGDVAACARPGLMVLPDPCLWPTREAYAELVCHETGHSLRWRHDAAGRTLEPLPPAPPPPPEVLGPEP